MIEAVTIKFRSDAIAWSVAADFGPLAPSSFKISLLTAPNTYRKSTLLGLLTRWIVLGPKWKDTRSKDFPGAFDTGSSLSLVAAAGAATLNHETVSLCISKVIAVSGTAFDRFPTSSLQTKGWLPYTYFGPRSHGNIISRSQSIHALAELLTGSEIEEIVKKLEMCGVLKVLGLVHATDLYFRFRPKNMNARDWMKDDLEQYCRILDDAIEAGDFTLSGLSRSGDEPAAYRREHYHKRELWRFGGLDGSEASMNSLNKRITSARQALDSFGWDRVRKASSGPPSQQEILAFRLIEQDQNSVVKDDSNSEESADLSGATIVTLFQLGYLVPSHIAFLSGAGRKVSTEMMSSGEFHLFTSIAGVALAACDNCVVMIDEPENSLHPAWQAQFIDMITNSLSHIHNVQVIIATHSPLLASGIAPENGNILVGRRRNTRTGSAISFTEGKKASFGHSADELLVDYFGLPTARNYFFATMLQRAVDLYARNATDADEYRDLCVDLTRIKSQLSSEDPLQDLLEELISASAENQSS